MADLKLHWALVRREQARLCSTLGSCETIRRIIADHGVLIADPPRTVRELYEHLETCPECAHLAVVLQSRATPNGGRAGVICRLTTYIAAQRIVEGSHQVATPDEAERWLAEQAEAKRKADAEATARKLQVAVVQGAAGEIQILPPIPPPAQPTISETGQEAPVGRQGRSGPRR